MSDLSGKQSSGSRNSSDESVELGRKSALDACGGYHVAALTESETLSCIENNDQGQCTVSNSLQLARPISATLLIPRVPVVPAVACSQQSLSSSTQSTSDDEFDQMRDLMAIVQVKPDAPQQRQMCQIKREMGSSDFKASCLQVRNMSKILPGRTGAISVRGTAGELVDLMRTVNEIQNKLKPPYISIAIRKLILRLLDKLVEMENCGVPLEIGSLKAEFIPLVASKNQISRSLRQRLSDVLTAVKGVFPDSPDKRFWEVPLSATAAVIHLIKMTMQLHSDVQYSITIKNMGRHLLVTVYMDNIEKENAVLDELNTCFLQCGVSDVTAVIKAAVDGAALTHVSCGIMPHNISPTA
jgi:hypothetical protein